MTLALADDGLLLAALTTPEGRLVYGDWLYDQAEDALAAAVTATVERIDALKVAVKALLPRVRDAWLGIGLATAQESDREAARDLMPAVYAAGGLKPPCEYIWLRSPLEGVVGAAMLTGAQVWAQVWDQVGAQVYRCGYGQHDATWLAFYSAFRLLGLPVCDRLLPLFQLATCCGWWWPFKDAVICTARPTELVMRKGKLVRVAYSDGFVVEGKA